MTEAEQAYAAAERLIAEAKASGATGLSFDREECRALTTIPPQIAELRQLKVVDLIRTKVTDIAFIADLTALSELWLNDTEVSDLAPLAALKEIEVLWLTNTKVSNLAHLAAMTGMTSLLLDNTKVSDLGPLAAMIGLKELSLANTKVMDLQPLTGMTELRYLKLTNTRVSNLTPISQSTSITELWLDHTRARDLSPLSDMELGMLNVSSTPISDLTPLVKTSRLTELWIDYTSVSKLPIMSEMGNIMYLGLRGTKIKDISGLAEVPWITQLALDDNQTLDLRPLLALKKLATEPDHFGLTFRNCAAARADPRIAEIAEIKNNAKRAQVLFKYLEGWEPPVPPVPPQRAAPIVAAFDDRDVLVEAPIQSELTGDRAERAKAGWDALREVHDEVAEILSRPNLPNLARAIAAFGRALGESYETMRPIALGTHGQRIVAISRTSAATLLDDAEGELLAYAAAIDLHLQRFPDWVAYLRDAPEQAESPSLQIALPRLREVSALFHDVESISPQLAQKFDDLVHAAEDADLPPALVRTGVMASLSNILAAFAWRALQTGRKVVKDFGKATYDAGMKAGGGTTIAAAADLVFNKGQIMLWLAREYPNYLGWLEAVLRWLGKV